ncbi:MAG: GW dipeptide domain-containing protein [Aggregatilineales bacterium]
MDKATFERIVTVLLPHLRTLPEREAFINSAFQDAPNLKAKLNFDGSAKQFTTHLVQSSIDFGEVSPGQPAVGLLLEEVKIYVGTNAHPEIDTLIAQLKTTPVNTGSGERQIKTAKNSPSRFEAISLVLAFIGTAAAVIALLPMLTGGNSSEPTTQSTPATPVAIALRDLEIREGPGQDFARDDILLEADRRDTLGISDNRVWYQILRMDGSTGWILAAASGVRIDGNQSLIPTIVPTLTATYTPSHTSTAILTLTPMNTATEKPSPTETSLPTEIPLPTQTSPAIQIVLPTSTLVIVNTSIPVQAQGYPCDATISPNSVSSILNVVRQFPNREAIITASVRRSDSVTIIDQSSGTDLYYQIQQNGRTIGWIAEEYLVLSPGCP